MESNKSLFYKERKWNDFHFYNGLVLPEVKIIQPSIYHEYRGSISTTYHSDFYDRLLPAIERADGLQFKHDRYSKSKFGVLRGLHWDEKTWKLISCLHGKIYLVVLDVREKQPNFGKWETFIIGPETGTQVLIPPYFANGHFVMEDDSLFHYKMAYKGEYNDENKQQTIVFNDKRFNIDWPIDNPILSKRDRNGN